MNTIKNIALISVFVVLTALNEVNVKAFKEPFVGIDNLSLTQDSLLIANFSPGLNLPGRLKEKSAYSVVITGYSSMPEETDDTPFITASGYRVRDGVVASNFLPLGTYIKIPELFGDKVFVVEDRMASRKKWNVDIWFASKEEALQFGLQKARIEVL